MQAVLADTSWDRTVAAMEALIARASARPKTSRPVGDAVPA